MPTIFDDMQIEKHRNRCGTAESDKHLLPKSAYPVQCTDMNETVIPQRERSPKRKYERNGARVSCYEIEGVGGTGLDPEYMLSKEPIFTIQLNNEDSAKALMDDLYYGEYTGA